MPPGPPPAGDAPVEPGWRVWVLGARVRTLPAAVAPVFVGTAAAVGSGGSGTGPAGVIWWRFVAAMVVALSVQVGTNYANDYSDGRRGTDDPGRRVGPQRLVGSGLVAPERVKAAMLACFAVTLVAGTPLVLVVDWRLAFVGLAAVAAGWFYTGGPRPYGYAGFGEVFVFVFFGLVATLGSTYVQDMSLPAVAWVAAVAMGACSTALLVVNNLRDRPSDAASGKVTLAVRIGDRATRVFYVALLVVPVIAIPAMVAAGASAVVALGFVSVVLSRRAVLAVLSGARGEALFPVLATTGLVQLVYSAAVTIGLAVT